MKPNKIMFARMQTRAAVLALLVSGLGLSAQTTNETYKLRATVIEVAQLREYNGTVARTHTPDPRFALTVRIESITPALAGCTNGSLMTFAVRSPAKLGLDGSSKGQKYDFVISREIHGDARGDWWFESPAMPIDQEGGAEKASRPVRSGTNSTSSASGSRR